MPLYFLNGAAITNNHRLGYTTETINLNNRSLFLGLDLKSETKVSAEVVSPEASPWLEGGHPPAASGHSHPSMLAWPWYL